MAGAAPAPPPLLGALLKNVARSFYLTLRVLPRAIRPQIGLAYLLARTTDTIADTGLVPLPQRLNALRHLRERVAGSSRARLEFADLAHSQGTPAERTLLERADEALAVLESFPAPDQQCIRQVLATITSGQELDLQRFGGADARHIVALPAEADLDDYTYRVAGCVGEFWTRLCRAHLFPDAPLDDVVLLEKGVRFGQGLQLVNILRDLPADLRQGRCYIPASQLSAHGLAPADLLEARHEERFRPLYDALLDKAHAHLATGWDYTNMLPRGCARVRLGCAWPILIGVKTLARLREARVLAASAPVKVDRAEVRGIVARTLVCVFWPARWQRLLAWAGRG